MTVDLKEQATENLRFIRGAMERAERLSAVSGAGLMLVGLVAVVAMALAADLNPLRERLTIWIGAAFVALVVGGLATWLKARRNQLMLIGDPGRRFLLCLIPVLIVGGVMTSALWRTPDVGLLPGLWTMLYGCGVLAAGTYAVPPIMHMGACLVVSGLFTHAVPEEWSNLLLGLSFGVLNLYFGYQVYRHHGG
jgi:hypothetical protein